MSRSIWRYILWRILMVIPLIIGVVTIAFALIQLAPGDPVDILVGEYPATPEYKEELRARLGLDKSPLGQYISYITTLVHGDLGYSFRNNRPVADVIIERLPATLLLMGSAMIFAAIVGVFLGVLGSLQPYSLLDGAVSVTAIMGYSMPVFWLGQILLVILAVKINLFPVQGMRSIVPPTTTLEQYADILHHLALPMLALTFRYIAINTRLTRSSMLEVMRQDYILTAQAKGLTQRRVIWKHALGNALLPVVTVIGFSFGYVLTGSVLVETVFGWPGIGRLLFESLGARDFPVMLGIFILGASTAIAAALITDIVYAILDPRIRY